MAIEHMISNIQAEIGNIPKAAIRRELVKAARDFCREVYVVTRIIQVIMEAGETEKAIPQPEGLSTFRIIEIKGSTTVSYTQSSKTEITLNAPLLNDVRLDIEVACRPAPGATTLPSELDNWDKALEAKALVQLFKKPNKAWTDISQAVIYQGEYDSEVYRAKQLAVNGYVSGPVRAPLRKFI